MSKSILKVVCYLIVFSVFVSCIRKPDSKDLEQFNKPIVGDRASYIQPIEGEDEGIDTVLEARGKVLISYSDCYTCHKEDKKGIGPAFTDINLRYPRKEVFIKVLAQRIIHGGRGAWGHSEMSAHPNLSSQDAEAMVTYILSFSSSKTLN